MKTSSTRSDNERARQRHRSDRRGSSSQGGSRRKEKLDARALLQLMREHKTVSLLAVTAITILGTFWMAIQLAT